MSSHTHHLHHPQSVLHPQHIQITQKDLPPLVDGWASFIAIHSKPFYLGHLPYPGRPCDEEGKYLPDGTLPPPRFNPGPDDWDPFEDKVQILTGDFLYWQEEMSAGNIDILLDLWALNMAKHDKLGLFSSYEHIYANIDGIKQEDAPWKSFTTSFAGELGPTLLAGSLKMTKSGFETQM